MRDNNNNLQRGSRLGLISSLASSLAHFRGPLIAEMARRGIKVYALAPDYDAKTRAAVEALGAIPVDYSMSRAGMNPVRDLADLVRLSLQLRRLELDCVFCYFIKPVIYGTLAATFAGVRRRFATIEGAGYVFTDSARPTFKRKLLRAFVVRLYRAALSQTERVFMLNRDDRQLFVDERMVAPHKVQSLSGIGLELDHYTAASPVTEPVRFLLIGRLLREKGVYDFIEAARIVKRTHPQARFCLLGSGDANPGAIPEREAEGWVAEGLIEWPGQVPDVREWIARSSVFVLPSYREGLPRSTQEAMAMGRPVITTDVPGCRETVEHGVNGLMVPVRDPASLAAAMVTFIEQPALIARMGEQGRRMAEERFDVRKINALILDTMRFAGAPAPAGAERALREQ
jgi:glycosyltransferase involved in cell wall biosynthesis